LSAGKLSIDNGSGLSRTSKISAKILADMYDHAYKRYGKRWMKTLSIAGVDGTIKRRFRGTSVRNRAWMKTGTLRRTKNIGGYVKSKSGRLYTAVILVETRKGNWRASALQNNILKWLVGYKEKGKVRTKKVQGYSTKELWNNTDTYLDTRYYVQVGSFQKQPTRAYLERIELLGLAYKVLHETKYKVLIGAYAKEYEAREDLEKVRLHISKGAFLTKL
jgi:D-alanyl-D-alanine carboxypeptidase/D-alanyl-D-alanine-endopeptidase (penicillin-binding protein 4)